MDDKEKSQTCEEAELYYLSLAFGGEYGDVPEQVAVHVKSCDYCRRQLKELKDRLLIADAIDSVDSRLSEVQIRVLGLHFAYLGKEVGCEIVKPFLPLLLEPSFNVRVPTPITVHVDRCELCSRDLAAIRAMGLTGKQLRVLNSILGDNSSVQNVDCSVAASSIQQYVSFNFQAIEVEVVKHLCCCNVCQSLVCKARAANIRNLRGGNVRTAFPCESVTFSDVFDYCFPYGLVPCGDQYAGFREPFVNELKQCAKCLQKLQELHQQVHAVKQRPESGIATVYEIGEVPKSGFTPQTRSSYGGFPINVRTVEPAGKQLLQGIQQRPSLSRNVGLHTVKTGFKYVVKAAIAAVVILGVAFFLRSTPSAAAVTIRQVYDAIQKAVNVHIQQFAAESSEPLQEKWVSKDLGIYAVKDERSLVVWDITNKQKYTTTLGVTGQDTVHLTELETATMGRKIHSSLDIMPFEDISKLPENARWLKLDASLLKDVSAEAQIYELQWKVTTIDESIFFFKWRGFIEKATNRPLRVELYSRVGDSGEYKLETVRTVEYWSKSRMEAFLIQVSP
jgi:hypothetical protein